MALADDTASRQRPGKMAIMRAAVAVMGEVGYESASVRDMAARGQRQRRRALLPLPVEGRPAARVPRRGVGGLARPHRPPPARSPATNPFARLDCVVAHDRRQPDPRRLRQAGVERGPARLHAPRPARAHGDRAQVRPDARRRRAGARRRHRGGAFSIDEPRVGAKAILALTTTWPRRLAAEGRTKDDVDRHRAAPRPGGCDGVTLVETPARRLCVSASTRSARDALTQSECRAHRRRHGPSSRMRLDVFVA